MSGIVSVLHGAIAHQVFGGDTLRAVAPLFNRANRLGSLLALFRLREVILEGGFTRVRRAAETPFNMIIESRP